MCCKFYSHLENLFLNALRNTENLFLNALRNGESIIKNLYVSASACVYALWFINVPWNIHFLFSCPTLTPVRDSAYVYFENSNLNLNSENPNEILVQMCGGQNIENMGKFVECLYKERKKNIYKWITVGRNTPWYNVYIIFECEKTLT